MSGLPPAEGPPDGPVGPASAQPQPPPPVPLPPGSAGHRLLPPLLVGVVAVGVAVVVGVALAAALWGLGLTSTNPLRLGLWLAANGLLGGWFHDVDATGVGPGLEWTTWVSGAPMLVTLAALGFVAFAARRPGGGGGRGDGSGSGSGSLAAVVAGLGGLAGATVVVFFGFTNVENLNSAGQVTVNSGPTWLWTGGTHPGTLVGAFVLIGGGWWVNTAGLRWWRSGRAVAYGVLIIPGLVLTVVAAAGLVYLTSSVAVGVAAVLLFPLLGVLVVLGLGGVPVDAGLTRVSPEPYVLWTWPSGWTVGVGGLIAVVLLAAVVGLVLRWRGHDGGRVAGVTVTAGVAVFIAWAADAAAVVPDSLGGASRLAANPLVALVVGGLLGGVAVAARDLARNRSTERPRELPTGEEPGTTRA